jgi:hypothetical protein
MVSPSRILGACLRSRERQSSLKLMITASSQCQLSLLKQILDVLVEEGVNDETMSSV